jgi:hypothetical protein
MLSKVTTKQVCGWREWVTLSELGVDKIKAKVDTGARTSALHAWHIHEVERNGEPWARFCVHPNQRTMIGEVWCEAPIVDQRKVRNSGGKAEHRYVVETELKLGADAWPIELTLTSRDDMGFRMLLGRTAIRRKLLVDPGRSYLLGGKPEAKTRQKTSKKKKSGKKSHPQR